MFILHDFKGNKNEVSHHHKCNERQNVGNNVLKRGAIKDIITIHCRGLLTTTYELPQFKKEKKRSLSLLYSHN